MNNNIDLDYTPTGSNNIYISGDSTDIEYSPLPIKDGNTEIVDISVPFHLSTSIRLQPRMRYRNKTGFTGQMPIEYMKMGTLLEFMKHAKIDVCGSLFKGNKRGKNRMIQTDVLVFDIDNDVKQLPSLMDDESLHLTIERFTELFKDYDFLISTSLNHMKEKNGAFARHKFHVFMGIGRMIADEYEVEELIDKLDYYIKSQTHNYEKVEMGSEKDYTLIDGALGQHSQVWGNEDTDIYYNKGGSIYDLLHEKTFSDDYRGYKQHSGEHRNRRYKENKTAFGDYELNKDYLLDDWDYVNIISRVTLNEFYDIAFKSGNYYMGYCELHGDDKPSLQIFENGGYNCLADGCMKHGASALEYQALKTNSTQAQVRNKYIKQLGDITKQDFLIWMDDKNEKKKDTADSDDVVVDKKLDASFDESLEEEGLKGNDKDEYFLWITKTGSLRANKELYAIMENMNHKHAILSHSGQIKVMGRETSRNSDYKEYVFPSIDDFKKRYKNDRYYVRAFNAKQEPIVREMSIGDIWELWEHRRQYDGIDFWPYDDRNNRYDDDEVVWDYWDDWSSANKENGWTGERVKRGLQKFMDIGVLNSLSTSKQREDAYEGCSRWIHNVRHNVLGNYTGENNARFMTYLLAWCSRTLTHHGKDRAKIVPVLKGNQGVGKGMFASRFGELFGKHFLHIQNSKQVGQRFNMQMMDALLVYVNEAVFAGNKETQNQLKGLITEDEIQLEQKYLPSFMGKSHMRFMYSSNEDWVVPIEWDNRRYWMLECTNKLSGVAKDEYFDELMKQWNLTGKESLFKFLTCDYIMDMAAEIRFESEMPLTSASSVQLEQTDDVYGWLKSVLTKGGHYIYDGGTATTVHWEGTGTYGNTFGITEIMADYIKYSRDKGMTYKKEPQQLSTRIGQISKKMGWTFRTRRVNANTAKRNGWTSTVWEFQDINVIRDIWVKELYNGSYEDAGLGTENAEDVEDFTNDDDGDMPASIRDRNKRMNNMDFSDMK